MARYVIRAQDPSGSFVRADWSTPHLPREGEQVSLPEFSDKDDRWQELDVEQILHLPESCEVWLGGTGGWDPGSVSQLFENARAYRERSG